MSRRLLCCVCAALGALVVLTALTPFSGARTQAGPASSQERSKEAVVHDSAIEAGMRIWPVQLFLLVDGKSLSSTSALVSVEMTGSGSFAWTIQVHEPGLVVSPAGGTAPGWFEVAPDVEWFAITGTQMVSASSGLPHSFAFTLTVSAEPTTAGSPFTLPVTVRWVESMRRLYLPGVQQKGSSQKATDFGLDFVTLVESPASEERFQRAVQAGARWDRWPLYWPHVETSQGEYWWDAVDHAVIADTAHGLQVDAVLLFTPGFYATGGNRMAPIPRVGPQGGTGRVQGQSRDQVSSAASPPAGLGNPVFADGTDTPGAGKAVNPENPWAQFVYRTVSRYKPGGELAQERGWASGRGVRHWEVWNEEDTSGFWLGTPEQYARLLKVAWLAARQADPEAKIIVGGLATYEHPSWLSDMLAEISTYPDHESSGWFFDSVAEHNYAWAWQTWYYLYQAWGTLKAYTVTDKTLWLTESGVAVCGDAPGPGCVESHQPPNEPTYRASPEEQAAYVLQSAAYAAWINSIAPVETIFHFQLYDDCTNYYPEYGIGGGFGMMRNPTGWGCGASPNPDTPRPSYAAYQAVTSHLRDLTPRWRARPGWMPGDAEHLGQEWFSFYRATTGERVMVLWARGTVSQAAVVTATSTSARLVGLDGTATTITPANGTYTIELPAATNDSMPTDGEDSAPIGGRPYLLIESDPVGSGGPKP